MKDLTNDRPFDRVIGWTGIALFVFVCISGLYPSAVNWGAHFWGFLPRPLVFLLAALFIVSLLTPTQTYLMNLLGKIAPHSRRKPTPFRRVLLGAGILAIAGLFWVLRERTYFLGDGYLLLRSLPLAALSGDVPASFPTAPLTGYLAVQAYRFFQSVGAAEPALAAWQSLSFAGGLLALPLAWNLAGLLWDDVRERIPAVLVILFGGSAMLFFGHVETYALVFAGLLAYIGAALGVQRGSRTLLSASVVFALLCLLHVGMIVLAPSLAYLFVREKRAHGWRTLLVPAFLSAGVFVLGLVLVGYPIPRLLATFVRDGTSFLSISAADPWGEAYTLFSPWHLVDLINIFLLISPLSLVLVGGFLASSMLPARYRQADAIFWIVLAGPALIWLFLNNFELGLSRDWDLAAPFVLVAALAGIVSWSILVGPSTVRVRGLVVMACLTLLQTAAWVGVNASVRSSLLRFESLLDFRFQSQRAAAIALEEIGGYRRGRNDLEGAASAYAQCVVLDSTNARRWMLLANAAASAGDDQAARSAYQRAIDLGTDDPDAYLNLGILRYNAGDVSGGIRLVEDAFTRDSARVLIPFTIARMYQDGAKDPAAALPWFSRTLLLDSTHAEARARKAGCLQGLSLQRTPADDNGRHAK
jgi:tetratricopeptide (TPR) repeat protein